MWNLFYDLWTPNDSSLLLGWSWYPLFCIIENTVTESTILHIKMGIYFKLQLPYSIPWSKLGCKSQFISYHLQLCARWYDADLVSLSLSDFNFPSHWWSGMSHPSLSTVAWVQILHPTTSCTVDEHYNYYTNRCPLTLHYIT